MSEQNKTTETQKMMKYILNHQYAYIDIKNKQIIALFIQTLHNLDQSPTSLKIIKNVLSNFGAPVTPFLKCFYSNLDQDFTSKYQKQLKILAAHVYELSNKEEIPQFNFIFKFNRAPENIVKYTLKQKEIRYLQQIKIITQYYTSQTLDKQQYKLQMQQNIQQYQKIGNHLYNKSLLQFEKISKAMHQKMQLVQRQFSSEQSQDESQSDIFDIIKKKAATNQISQISQISQNKRMQEEQKNLNQTLLEKQEQSPKQQIESSQRQYFIQGNRSQTLQTTDKSDIPTYSLTESSIDQNKSITTVKNRQNFIYQQQESSWIDQSQPLNIQQTINPSMSKSNRTKFLCCRKFLYQGENIYENNDTRIELVNYNYPFKNQEILSIKKIICSFLNTEGGILYVGIEKSPNGKRTAIGAAYSQSKKQSVLKSFRQIAQTIEPQIITHKMYNVVFVPLRNKSPPYNFIPGKFVIKCDVRYGIRDQIYSFNDGTGDRFVFRNQGQTFMKQGRILLKTFRERILKPLQVPQPIHEGLCQKPDIGEQTHDYEQQYLGKAYYKNIQQNVENQAVFHRPKAQFKYSQNSYAAKESRQVQQKQIASQQFTIPKKQPPCSYFFVIGINESQLLPILEKKNLATSVRIQSTKSRKIVVKVMDMTVIKKIQKILEKLSLKYPESIKLYQMSLELKVDSVDDAKKLLANKSEKFKVWENNILRYNFYRDSLQAFILLSQSKIRVQFVNV